MVSPGVRVGLLCMFPTKSRLCLHSRSMWEPHGLGVHVGILLFHDIFFIMKPCLGAWGQGEVHGVECCLCTARLTHRCFPNSCPALLCHCAFSSTPSSSLVVAACFSSPVPSVAASTSGTNTHLWLLLFFCRGRTGDYRRPA